MKQFMIVPLLLVGYAATASCQTVTLPIMRSGKSIEVTMLRHALLDVERDADSLAIIKGGALSRDSLRCDLAQLSLAPYTLKELREALDSAAVRTRAKSDTAATKAAPAPVTADERTRATRDTSARSLFGRELALLGRRRGRRPADETQQGLSELMQKAPDGCRLDVPPSESYVRVTVERYLDSEKDVERRARLDSLGRIALANVIQAKLRERHFVPVKTHDQALAFWKQSSSSTLNVGAIGGSGDLGTAFTELTSRFLHPVRLSINAVIAAAKDSATNASTTPSTTSDTGKSESAIARFLNGGGLINLAAAWPWVHVGSASGAGDLIGLLSSRVGATLPVLGASARDTTLMYDAGADFFLKSADYADHIGVYVQSRAGFAGGSQRFMASIGEPDRKHTWYQTVSLGLSLDEKYLITFSRTVSGPHSLQTGWQIGTTLARSAALPSASNR